jgi:hypothetical protein
MISVKAVTTLKRTICSRAFAGSRRSHRPWARMSARTVTTAEATVRTSRRGHVMPSESCQTLMFASAMAAVPRAAVSARDSRTMTRAGSFARTMPTSSRRFPRIAAVTNAHGPAVHHLRLPERGGKLLRAASDKPLHQPQHGTADTPLDIDGAEGGHRDEPHSVRRARVRRDGTSPRVEGKVGQADKRAPSPREAATGAPSAPARFHSSLAATAGAG